MKTYTMVNLVALATITLGLILHILCLSTPYMAAQNMHDLGSAMKQAQNDSRFRDIAKNIVPVNVDVSAMRGTVHVGLWKMCFEGLYSLDPNSPNVPDTCLTIKGDDKTMSTGTNSVVPGPALYSWMKACRALSIIGAIVTALAMVLTLVHVVWQSKGDRRRLMPFFLFGFCLVGGVFILVANIVFALNYRDMVGDRVPVPPAYSSLVEYLVDKSSHLCWGLGLDIFSAVLAFAAGLIVLFVKWREDMGNAGIV